MHSIKIPFLFYLVGCSLFPAEAGDLTGCKYDLGSLPVKVMFSASSSSEWNISQAKSMILCTEIPAGFNSAGTGCLLTV